MTTKDALYRLIDAIPEHERDAARSALVPLADPVLLSPAHAPLDDEPGTDEERAAVEEGWEAYRRGEWVSAEDVEELGSAPLS